MTNQNVANGDALAKLLDRFHAKNKSMSSAVTVPTTPPMTSICSSRGICRATWPERHR
ncbi:MAG: hypothetical protein VB140_05120 [Burkholderia sp.]